MTFDVCLSLTITLFLQTLAGNAHFDDVSKALQKEVNALKSRGVNKIIVLGHCYRFLEEGNEAVDIARTVSGVDIIVLGGALLFQCNGKMISCNYSKRLIISAVLYIGPIIYLSSATFFHYAMFPFP